MKLKTVAAGGLFIASMQSMLCIAATTPIANADPHTHDEYVVCAQLEADPTFGGVTNIARSMMQVMDATTAADTVADAVTYVCPKYAPLIDAWANSNRTQPPASTTGGIRTDTVV